MMNASRQWTEENGRGAVYTVDMRYPDLIGIDAPTSTLEGGRYCYSAAGHIARFIYPGVSDGEAAAFQNGEWRFGVLALQGVVFVLARCENFLAWGDFPYCWHLLPSEDRLTPPMPEPPDPEHAVMHLHLAESRTGILRALRVLTLSPHFTRTLHAAIREQAASPWAGIAAYQDSVQRVRASYTSRDMLKMAWAKCVGGE